MRAGRHEHIIPEGFGIAEEDHEPNFEVDCLSSKQSPFTKIARTTYVATKNAGKLAELQAIFAGSALELDVFTDYADVEETGDTYEANALLKARALARQLRDAGISAAALADDSGLEVAALHGRPGVYSARYGGSEVSWLHRRARLLEELRNVEQRGARFVCTMAFVEPDGRETIAIGTVEGWIAECERGAGGFGYDPLFVYPPSGCTFAELSAEEKNAVSHRHNAAKALVHKLHLRDLPNRPVQEH